MSASLIDAHGSVSSEALARLIERAASVLAAGRMDLAEARVAILVPPGREYVAALYGTWRAGGVAVPLALSHPPAELDYVMRDAGVSIVVVTAALRDRVAATAGAIGAALVDPAVFETTEARTPPADVGTDRRAMMLYTSGTTGRPKGVVTTHGNLAAQVAALVESWRWTGADRTLLVLPLHHVHGIVNVVCSAMHAGATCEMAERFDAVATWARLASGDITIFTAVPTIYYRLIQQWEAEPALQATRSAGASRARLMMSGSAALPVPTLERWRAMTGHTLLERYGMTEIGMALANPLDGERRAGFVGGPLPGVSVRLVDDAGRPVADGQPGEIEVRGPTVFLEYWQRPEATAEAFRDGWFRTGDTAVTDRGAYRLLGRTNVDILKTGGFKVSALEIEDTLRQFPAVRDCAVVGVDDPEWGQRICVAVEVESGAEWQPDVVRSWLAERLAPYKVPRAWQTVDALPRNAMGKVVKPDVTRWFVPPAAPRPVGTRS